LGAASPEPSYSQWPHLGNPVEVTVHVKDAELVVQGSLGDEQVGDRRAVPHPVMVSEIALQSQGALEDVRWRGNRLETEVELVAK
jgi:hypothetical protein